MKTGVVIAAVILSAITSGAQLVSEGPHHLENAAVHLSWLPPGIDDMRPAVAAGVDCPEQRVLDGATQSVQQLVNNLERFQATEELVQQQVDARGKQRGQEKRRFTYVAMISKVDGIPTVQEFREARSQPDESPDGIATQGLAALALIFHPAMRDSYAWQCEGQGQWQGRPTWLLHFRQRDDRPNHLLGYELHNQTYMASLKGRAWIAADTFQVVHIEADLVRPIPEIRLTVHHQVVDYGPVSFVARHTALWLPRKAELYFFFRGHRYRRTHTFDKFKVFSVDATEQVAGPALP